MTRTAFDEQRPIELCVLSGKGGTGKTTITSSLAVLAPRPLVLADCDVDAANLHLALRAREVARWPFECGELARIDEERCLGCGECAAVCRFGAVKLERGSFRIDPLACEGCRVCAAICLEEAISIRTRRSGDVYFSRCVTGDLVHARLLPGRESSGKLVTAVREEAANLARSRGAHLILIDGAPGIACPVIASLRGVDAALLVVEPTPSGRQGFERALQVARHFGVPALACMNRMGLAPDREREIESVLEESGVPLLARIPFDRSVVEANAAVKPAVEAASASVREALEELAQETFARLNGIGVQSNLL